MNAHKRLGLHIDQYPWHHFIARSGEPGERLVQDFDTYHGDDLTHQVDRALALLRGRRLDEGRALLHRSAESIDALRGSAPMSVIYVLERWLHSALAYQRYLEEDFDGAEYSFELAVEAIRSAVEELPCLVMMANHCYDFRAQRARIARNRFRWESMADHIEAGRAMLDNRLPLCILNNGKEIFIEAVDAFHRAIEPRDEEERATLEELVDPERRRRSFERSVKDNYALPCLVIPYHPTHTATGAR